MQNKRGKQRSGVAIFNSLFEGIQSHFSMFYIAYTDMLRVSMFYPEGFYYKTQKQQKTR